MAVAAKTFALLDELKRSGGFPTANKDKRLHHVSPSQIGTFRDCPRKWYLETVIGLRQPETESQRLGTEVHLVLEQLIHDEQPQASQRAVEIALAGQHLLPAQGTPCTTEVEFVLRDPRVALPLYGFKDLVTPEYVADHKTTSNISKYAKSEYQWQTDPQAVIYSAHELSIGRPKDFRVNYYQTRGRRQSDFVQIRMSKESVDFGMQLIGENVSHMVSYATLPESDVPFGPNGDMTTDSCEKYGGCHLKMRCLAHGVVPESMGAFQETASALAAAHSSERSPNMSQVLTAKERMARARELAAQAAQKADDGAQTINPPQLPGDPPLGQTPAVVLDDALPEDAPPPPPPSASVSAETLPPPPPAPSRTKAARARAAESMPSSGAVAAEPAIEVLAPDAIDTIPAPLNIPVNVQALENAVVLAKTALSDMERVLSDLQRKTTKYHQLVLEGDEDAEELYDKTKARALETERATELHRRIVAEAERALEKGIKDVEEQERREKEARLKKEQEARRVAVPEAQTLYVPTAVKVSDAAIAAPSTSLTNGGNTRRTLYLGCSPSVEKNIVFFDVWVQPYLQRAAEARQVPFYRMIPHGAIDAVVTEIVADFRSGKAAPPQNLVFREFAAQHYPYVQDLSPFYDEIVR